MLSVETSPERRPDWKYCCFFLSLLDVAMSRSLVSTINRSIKHHGYLIVKVRGYCHFPRKGHVGTMSADLQIVFVSSGFRQISWAENVRFPPNNCIKFMMADGDGTYDGTWSWPVYGEVMVFSVLDNGTNR